MRYDINVCFYNYIYISQYSKIVLMFYIHTLSYIVIFDFVHCLL